MVLCWSWLGSLLQLHSAGGGAELGGPKAPPSHRGAWCQLLTGLAWFSCTTSRPPVGPTQLLHGVAGSGLQECGSKPAMPLKAEARTGAVSLLPHPLDQRKNQAQPDSGEGEIDSTPDERRGKVRLQRAWDSLASVYYILFYLL